jgi:hypothetical protein
VQHLNNVNEFVALRRSMQQSTVSGNERTVRTDTTGAGHSDKKFKTQTGVILVPG